MRVNLPRGAVLSVRLNEQDCSIRCREGRLWITMTGDDRDHCLRGGSEYRVSGKGKIVVQAVSSSSVEVTGESPLELSIEEHHTTLCETAHATVMLMPA